MKMTNYKNNDQLLHCAKCNGVLLKNVEKKDMTGEVSFLTKCPHCGNPTDIKLSSHGNFLETNSGLQNDVHSIGAVVFWLIYGLDSII